MNYLITGGSGFIGYHLSNLLSKSKKNKIFILDNLSRGKLDKDLKVLLKRSNVKLIKADLKKLNKKFLNISFDIVYHFAAIVGVKNVTSKPYKVLEENILTTLKLIEFLKNKKKIKKFCFTSTSEVYANTILKEKKKIPTPEFIDLTISKDITSRSTYLLSKIVGEYLCYFSDLPYIIFRPHNIYGPRMGNSHVIPELINKIKKIKDGEELKIISHNHSRSFCYIDSAINMMYSISHKSNVKNKIFNVGSQNNEIKIIELAKLIANKMNKRVKFKGHYVQSGSPRRRVPLMNKLNKYIKSNHISIDYGVEKTINWYLQNI